MTTFNGISYFLANSKSLWSCAPTAITIPPAYSATTKFPAYTGTLSPVNGLIA